MPLARAGSEPFWELFIEQRLSAGEVPVFPEYIIVGQTLGSALSARRIG